MFSFWVLACCGQTQGPGSLAAGPQGSWGQDWCTDMWGCTLGPLQAVCLVTQLCPTLCDTVDCRPDCSPPDSFVHGDYPGKNAGMGCHALLQRIFPTQGSNPGLPHFRQILYHPRHQESPLGRMESHSELWSQSVLYQQSCWSVGLYFYLTYCLA